VILNRATTQFVMTVFALFASAISAAAQSKSRDIDVGQSSVTIHVSKSGLFSFAGDNHEIRAPISSGTVDEAAKTVELKVESAKLTVLDPKLSADKRSPSVRPRSARKSLPPGESPEI
jgi:hypothetical protein